MWRQVTRRAVRGWQLTAITALVAIALAGAGCDEDGIISTVSEDELAPPLGLGSITGNQQVTLTWFTSNFEGDFEGYIVYRTTGDVSTDQSIPLPAGFVEVDRVTASSSGTPRSMTVGGLANGTTYSFAVVAFRDGGDAISRTSNIVADTPRPDITSVTLTSASTNDVAGDDSSAGFRFDDFAVLGVPSSLAGASYMDPGGADIVHEAFDPGSSNANIRSWLAGMNGAGVQDLGYMTDLDGSDVAPSDGYAGNGESVLLTVGHVYAIRTGANRYGKIIVTTIEGAPDYRVTFNAAFQTKTGEPDYLRALGL
jgi:hypothetical protein